MPLLPTICVVKLSVPFTPVPWIQDPLRELLIPITECVGVVASLGTVFRIMSLRLVLLVSEAKQEWKCFRTLNGWLQKSLARSTKKSHTQGGAKVGLHL